MSEARASALDRGDVLTPQQAADALGWKVYDVYQAIKRGDLTAHRTGPHGGWQRIYRGDLEQFRRRLDDGARETAPAATPTVRIAPESLAALVDLLSDCEVEVTIRIKRPGP